MPSTINRSAAVALVAACTLLALFAARYTGLVGAACAYACINLFPGLALGLALDRQPTLGRLSLWTLVGSPAIAAGLAILLMLTGLQPDAAGRGLIIIFGVTALAAVSRSPSLRTSITRRHAVILGVFSAIVVLLTAYLPFSDEWWRIRSDAWFHAAVVAEIQDFGIPPTDPYFVGFVLQYMWFYHALVLVLSRACAADPFWIMAVLNVHALCGLIVATVMAAGVFRSRFAPRLASAATVVLGFNGIFWLFFPLKALKAFTGDVRGWDELTRMFTLTPLHYQTAFEFLNIYFNQEFFLDKFMVATAFGLGIGFMMTGWYAACSTIKARKRTTTALLFVALIGMLGFHSLVGFVALVGIFGGAILMHMQRGRIAGYSLRASAVLLATSLAAFVLMTPYLYAVMHLKESEQVFPLSFSLPKTIGIAVSSALAFLLALKQRRQLVAATPHARFFLLGTVALTLFCLSIKLPGPNTYDKLGYFVFLPLALAGGWTLADVAARVSRMKMMLLVLLCFVPVNAIAFVSFYATPPLVEVLPEEHALSRWVKANTDRRSVFIDNDDRVVLLVTGPRRYYWGRWPYAHQWGYDKLEMSRRYHTRRALYAPEPLDGTALASLAGIDEDIYVIVHDPDGNGATTAARNTAGLFREVYKDSAIAVMQVDRAACHNAAVDAKQVSDEELLRESGL